MGVVVLIVVVVVIVAFVVWNQKATKQNSTWTSDDECAWKHLNGKSYSERSAQEEALLKVLQSKMEVRRLRGLE